MANLEQFYRFRMVNEKGVAVSRQYRSQAVGEAMGEVKAGTNPDTLRFQHKPDGQWLPDAKANELFQFALKQYRENSTTGGRSRRSTGTPLQQAFKHLAQVATILAGESTFTTEHEAILKAALDSVNKNLPAKK